MKKRVKMSPKASKRVWSAGVRRTEPKNIALRPVRGGIRL